MMIDRKAKVYKIICPDCNKERLVAYAQNWNIKVGNSTGKCYSCKKTNLIGLKKGRGWNKGLKGFLSGHKAYFIAYGKDNPAWKGGTTPKGLKIRNSKEYFLWRKSVFERDNYTCEWCGQVGGQLVSDHIRPFSLFPELRLKKENGRTLCKECHKKTDTYLSKIYSYGL